MNYKDLFKEFDIKFKSNGSFYLLPTDSINLAVRRENIPQKYGIYVYFGCKGSENELIYIGKSGTLNQNGTFKNQKLPKRLTMKQDGMYREEFFKLIMAENNYDKLIFKWWITFDDQNKLLPGFVEGQLIQAYFEEFGCLPKYNKTF